MVVRERRSRSGLKIAAAIAQQYGNLAAALVGHGDVEITVAIEIARNYGVRNGATAGKVAGAWKLKPRPEPLPGKKAI